MPSPSGAIGWLLLKEWRELRTSHAWWTLLLLIGPLVGLSFVDAVRSYAEVSAGAGSACGVVCAPLVGIWAPTFGAFEIAAVFLLPFVAIRMVSGDQQSGALKLELQRALTPLTRVAVKAGVVLAGWCVAGLAAVVAIALWTSYGGSTYAPEIAVVMAGHLLNGAMTIALATAIATMTDHPSTAAIVTLAITIGTWIVDFAAAINGGIWERLAAFTPAALVALFQHGLVQANVTLVGLTVVAAGLAAAAVWIRWGVTRRRRAWDTVLVGAATAAVITACVFVRGAWDLSESRQNSFSEPEQELLEHLPAPLAISVHLSPQDPRRLQFDRGPLAKLRRVVPNLSVSYESRTASGLFEQTDRGYGEIEYAIGGRRDASRVITDEGVLETIFGVAGVSPNENESIADAGRPLVTRPAGAAVAFFAVWPACVLGLGRWTLGRKT